MFGYKENSACGDVGHILVAEVLCQHSELIVLLHQRYDGSGRSEKSMAVELQASRTDWSLLTCESRVDTWLKMAEFMLYAPMCQAIKEDGFRLQRCAEHA